VQCGADWRNSVYEIIYTTESKANDKEFGKNNEIDKPKDNKPVDNAKTKSDEEAQKVDDEKKAKDAQK